MKRKLLPLILCASMICTPFTAYADEVETETAQNREIMFRGIPWGTSYTDAVETLGNPDLMYESSMSFFSAYTEQILYNSGYDEKHSDFDISAVAFPVWDIDCELEVAGYTTASYTLYFGYSVVDGEISRNEDDMQLYAGQYFFETTNIDSMTQDLIEKLNSLYGEYSSTETGGDPYGNECQYAVWRDNSDGIISMNLSCSTYDGELAEVWLSYAWLGGNELLDTAYEAESNGAAANEAEAYGDGSTNGL